MLPCVNSGMVASLVVLVACGLAGLILRFWALALPFLLVPVLYLGLAQGWWGYGLGDAAEAAAVIYLAVALGITFIAAIVGTAIRSFRGRAVS